MRELLLVKLDGYRYGIPRDEVRAVEPVRELHHLPGSPAWIAGISIVEGATAVFADLASCLGLGRSDRAKPMQVLLLKQPNRIEGFVVNGQIETTNLAEAAWSTLPSHLATAVVHACAVSSNAPIPIVDLSRLAVELVLLEPGGRLAGPSLLPPSSGTAGVARAKAQLVRIGPFLYAVPGGAETVEGGANGAVPLPFGPPALTGVAAVNSALIPVIDAGRMLGTSASGDQLLLIEIKGSPFGVMVDEVRGAIPIPESGPVPLPSIARSRLLPAALLRGDEIIMLLDPGALVSGADKERLLETERQAKPSSDSGFSDLLFKADVDVLEFSLFGMRSAVPASEVEDELPLRPWRPVPGAAAIIAGVAEHQGALLPVFDLAAVFGMRSRPGPEWRMILARNGDFRGLVLTEAVYGERRLPVPVQREVPIAVPHRIVYGCYPDAEAVRLILNVQSLVMHFKKVLSGDLGALFSPVPAADKRAVAAEPVPAPVAVETEKVGPSAQEPIEASAVEPSIQGHEEAPPFAAAPEQAAPESEPEQEQVRVESAKITEEEAKPAEAAVVSASAEAPAPVDEVLRDPEVREEAVPGETLPASKQSGERTGHVPAHAARATAQQRREPVAAEPSPVPAGTRKLAVLKHGAWYAALALVLLAIFYPTSPFRKSGVTPPDETQTKAVRIEDKQVARPVSEAPLVLEVPASRAGNIEIYVVVEGDTLWSISMRFTGSPYNYPRIAGENRIADADLIFPGQRIRLVKK